MERSSKLGTSKQSSHGQKAHTPIIHIHHNFQNRKKLKLTPALTDFKGPTIIICYKRITVIANKEIEKLFFKSRIAIVISGFLLLVGPLKRD